MIPIFARVLLIATLAFAPAAHAQEVTVRTGPVAPTVSNEQSLIRFERVALTCGGQTVRPVTDVLPYSAIAWVGNDQQSKRQGFRFRIDETGRTLGIVRAEPISWVPFDTSDLAPSIAVLRFAAGKPQATCEIAFQPVVTPISQSNPADLAYYYAMPHRVTDQERRVYEALLPAGSTCKTFPRPQIVRYADVDRVSQEPGTASFAVLRFDVSKSGKPINIATLYSSGNAQLDRASRQALAGSRYKDARVGCVSRYVKQQNEVIPAPARTRPALEGASGTCGDVMRWVRPPSLNFPDNYTRRSIEGWALIEFAIAPWGATGSVKVLASEPSADFGENARNAMAGALQTPSKTGASGCTRMFSFKRPNGQPQTEARAN